MANPLQDAITFAKDKPLIAVGAAVVVAGGALLVLRKRPDATEDTSGAQVPAYDSVGTLYSTYPAPATPQTPNIRPISSRVKEGRQLGEGNPYVCPRGTVAFLDEKGRQQCRSTKSGKMQAPRIRVGDKWQTVTYG